jgi:large subunit ribosomal protein L23
MKGLSPIVKLITTEKSSSALGHKHYTFLVNPDATKVDVKKAIKELYGTDVEKVQMLITPKKVRLVGHGREITKRHKFKKAIIRLKGDKTIDPNKLKDTKKKQ